MPYQQPFIDYVRACLRENVLVEMKEALRIAMQEILVESPRPTNNIEDFKDLWINRLNYIYTESLNRRHNTKSAINLEMDEASWVNLYSDVIDYSIRFYARTSRTELRRLRQILDELEMQKFEYEGTKQLSRMTEREVNALIADKENFEKLDEKCYIFSMHELGVHERFICFPYEHGMTSTERLNLSSITYIGKNRLPATRKLQSAADFNVRNRTTFYDWKSCIRRNEFFHPALAPANIDQAKLNNFLYLANNSIFRSNNFNENRKVMLDPIDYVAQDIFSILQYLFPGGENIVDYRFVDPANSTVGDGNCFTLYTPDDNREIGFGIIRPGNTSEATLESDRVAMAEAMKRQVHLRIIKAKDTKEFYTFGILFHGHTIELFVMMFTDANPRVPYTMYQVETLINPTSFNTFGFADITLECLSGFKNLILNSLPTDEDVLKPYIGRNYSDILKPTILVNKDDD